jgi:putative membrane protein insertion efficiency factor
MGIVAKTLRGAIRLYQLFLSHFSAGSCRYLPSCSEYAMEAVEIHGAVRGGWLGFVRILRCNPWGGAGYDPVPPADCRNPICSHSPIHSHSDEAASPQAGAR